MGVRDRAARVAAAVPPPRSHPIPIPIRHPYGRIPYPYPDRDPDPWPSPGHAGKFTMYMTSSAAGISIPGVVPAASKPAPPSSAIVPHQSSLTEAAGYVDTKAGVSGRCGGPCGRLAEAGRSSG